MAANALDGAGQIMDKTKNILGKWQELSAGNGRHNLTLGNPGKNDVILYEEKVRKGSSMSHVTHEFEYQKNSGERITSVLAYDEWSDDTGGDAQRISGGVNQDHVTIKIKSRFMRGFHFKFIVYGQKS
ncbi:probable salivary secreted peptide [Clytia hemisphaerica]|uniref:Uncharacterized protein n=1 Tax=Clytia hemisphaerica TaxID=252671 RepID=A0A7M5V441_9CNID